ncbi:ATP-binding cassette domain-containing protein [Kibdelosporangium philippinense]|uniref:ATP-binding cassette domain-containing protein n=1 Tax=Kibdelosporangium philippinense TaxID=211113 RepID=A0ABS8ZLQ4_9PSEU|nr:ATP-binding cassette domain-containing protein [Kibdelosporangium philippinense]MCE7008699.1 ATP-binding cassette domain-containing protein [Kibdelosporangium philippinense]
MITIENVSKSFWSRTGNVVALDGVSLEVNAGAALGVVGPTGSGKSTLARVVSLQERPDTGAIRLDGLNTAALDTRSLRATRRQIGFVTGETQLFKQRTTAGNIALPLEQSGVDGPQRRARVGRLLDLIGLTDKAAAYPDDLTAGQRRRVAVARALVGEPGLLLADDPTANLDTDGAAGVLAVLDRARAELGVTLLVATQDTAVVRRICDDIALLDSGKLLEHGNLFDLLHDPESRVVQELLPVIDETGSVGHDRTADIVLIGFAAVGALLPEAASRFGVQVSVLGGGLTRLGETPVARFRIGLRGERSDGALGWIGERGGIVHQQLAGPRGVVAA